MAPATPAFLAVAALLSVAALVIVVDRMMGKSRHTRTKQRHIPHNGISDVFPPDYTKTAMDAVAFANFKKALVPSSYTVMTTTIEGSTVGATFHRSANDDEGLLVVLRRKTGSAPTGTDAVFDVVNLYPHVEDPAVLVAYRSSNSVGVRKDPTGGYMLLFQGREYNLYPSK